MAVQPAVEAPAQGSDLTASQPDLIGSIHFLFCAGFCLAHALSFFILLLSWFFLHPFSSHWRFRGGVGPLATRATSQPRRKGPGSEVGYLARILF